MYDSSPLTVFAPSNDALLSLSPAALAGLQSSDNREALRKILMFHFIPAKVSPFEWNGWKPTLLGSPVELQMGSDTFSVANVTVTTANAINTKKYDVYTISNLLFPPQFVVSDGGDELGSANAEPAVRRSTPILSRHGVRRDSFRDSVFDDDSQEAVFTDPHEVRDSIDGRRLARRQFYARPRHAAGSDGGNDQAEGRSSGNYEDGSESGYEVWQDQESAVDMDDEGMADVRRALAEDAADVAPRWGQGSGGGGGAGEAGGDAARRSALLEQMLSANLRLSAFAQGSDPAPEPTFIPYTADVSPGSKINNTNYDPESAAAAIAAGAMAGAGAGAAAAGNHIHSIIVGGTSDTPLLCHQYPLFLIKQVTENFSETRRIGSGGYADVLLSPFRGFSARAPPNTPTSRPQIHEMASKHHPNLVRLLGFCLDMDVVNERTEQILIYEYMLNGDLETWVGPGEPLRETMSGGTGETWVGPGERQ
ncbi:unnamed protein product [Closterium sp. Naga37s-1]|nr:unnamed protein product [Closterium sp. Naga37s-1]